MDLNTYTFGGNMTYMTVKGIEDVPLSYNIILAQDADESALKYAAEAIALFLIKSYQPYEEIQEDEDNNN